ncbi:TIGR00374 family protein [Halobacteriales archaeon SW_7_68_16]|nr:MAG: TIGR00374 family protein [Halobacteriales archaeon SW_7_68_16]
MDADARAAAAGFVGASVVLGVLLWFVGIDEVLTAVGRADLSVLAIVVAAAVTWLFCWGLALRTVLGTLGVSLSPQQSFVVFSAATFANNVTPFGQAGGEPFSAYLISRVADSEYETSLAAIASVDAINFVPSIGLALVGVGYYAVTATLTDRLGTAAAAVVGLGLCLTAVAYAGWTNRYRIELIAVRLVTSVVRAAFRLIPGRSPPSKTAIEDRIDGFFETIERIADSPRRLVTALVLSTLGWLALSSSLFLSMVALGSTDPKLFAAALIAVPLGAIAGVTPLPGGLGGIEAVLVALLVPITGLSPAAASAAVVLHRLATYWFPVIVGGGSTAAIRATRSRARARERRD